MNQYLVQNIAQIIDLFDKQDLNDTLNVVVTAFSPFSYAFVSKEALDSLDINTLPYQTSANIGINVDVNKRFMIVKAGNPTVVTVNKAIASQRAEMFSTAEIIKSPWYVMMLISSWTVILFIIFALILYGFKRTGISYIKPVNAAYKQFRSNRSNDDYSVSPVSKFMEAFGKNVDAGKDLVSRTARDPTYSALRK